MRRVTSRTVTCSGVSRQIARSHDARRAEIVGQGKAEADDRFRERERGPAVVCYNICNKQGLLANTSAR
jgi:hypothetical protein